MSKQIINRPPTVNLDDIRSITTFRFERLPWEEDEILVVKGLAERPDGLVEESLRALEAHYNRGVELQPGPAPGAEGEAAEAEAESNESDDGSGAGDRAGIAALTTVQRVRGLLLASGRTEQVARVTDRLNEGGLDRTQRLLLSTPGIYASLVEDAIEKNVDLEDSRGLLNYIRRRVDEPNGPRTALVRQVLRRALRTRGVDPDASTDPDVVRAFRGAVEVLRRSELPLKEVRALEVVLGLYDQQRESGIYAAAVEHFAASGEIDPTRLTPAVKRAMATYLRKAGVQIDREHLEGKYDEYMAMAYMNAVQAATAGGAIGDGVPAGPVAPTWDFTVDTFESVEDQGLVPEHILAAGALYYIHELGERMGLFRLADALVLRCASGGIDIAPGPGADRMDAYLDRREDYPSLEERGLHYRRILNAGQAELLAGMVPNEEFPALWGNLMTEVAEFIRRTEETARSASEISRQPIFHATRQLAANLSAFVTPLAPRTITKMYQHLMEARGILEEPQVVEYFGAGRRKNLWTVVERGSNEWFGQAPNVTAIRTSAVAGNAVFRWIADFDPATVTEHQFQTFRQAAEAWILAQPAAGAGAEHDGVPDEFSEREADLEEEFESDWDL